MSAPRRRGRPKKTDISQSIGIAMAENIVEETTVHTVDEIKPERKRSTKKEKPAEVDFVVSENAAAEEITAAENSCSKKEVTITHTATIEDIVNAVIAEENNGKKEQGDVVFALDIGTRTVVGVLGVMENDVFRLIDTETLAHPKRAMIDGQVEDIDRVALVAEQVKLALEERNNIRLTDVAVAAAGRALKTYMVSMDFDVSEKSIITADYVKVMEIETIQKAQMSIDEKYKRDNAVFYCVGHSIVRYLLDGYRISTLEGHKGETVTVELIAAFLPEAVVEGLYSVTDKIGLKVRSMTLEPIAAMNVIIPPEIRLINIALVDIGAGTSDIAIARDGSIVAYAMATVAGDEISEDIVKTFFVDFNTAERIKIEASKNDSVSFTDIFGNSRTVSSDDFNEKCVAGIDSLADVISQTVNEANGGYSPAAMFLIGGGSLANGLADNISEKLSIDRGRVVVGSQQFLKNVDTGDRVLGPEYVTPIGIAVTACSNMAYDFSIVTLNGEPVRVFDTKCLSVFELLGSAGYKSSQIMGHSGASLKYKLNGETKIAKGTPFVPAEINVNGSQAALTTKIKQGDVVRFVPSVNGENARAFIRDVAGMATSVRVGFCGENIVAGKHVYVNGREVDSNYEIQPLDEVVVKDMSTLGGLMAEKDIDVSSVYVNGLSQPADYQLCDGDDIGFNGRPPAFEQLYDNQGGYNQTINPYQQSTSYNQPTVQPYSQQSGQYVYNQPQNDYNGYNHQQFSQPVNNIQHGYNINNPYDIRNNGYSSPAYSQPQQNMNSYSTPYQPHNNYNNNDNGTGVFINQPRPQNSGYGQQLYGYNQPQYGQQIDYSNCVSIIFNNSPLDLPMKPSGTPYMLIDLFDLAHIDIEKPQCRLTLTVNGQNARFTDKIKSGDVVVIRQEVY